MRALRPYVVQNSGYTFLEQLYYQLSTTYAEDDDIMTFFESVAIDTNVALSDWDPIWYSAKNTQIIKV